MFCIQIIFNNPIKDCFWNKKCFATDFLRKPGLNRSFKDHCCTNFVYILLHINSEPKVSQIYIWHFYNIEKA